MGGASGKNLTLVENIVNFLKANNDSGNENYISEDMDRPLGNDNIIVGKPEFGKSITQFPCVFIKITNYDDEIRTLGQGGKRQIDYALEIYPVTNILSSSDKSASMKESYRFTDNILELIRDNHDLSMAGHWVDAVNVEFDVEIENAVNVYMNKITLQSHELA